MAHISGLVAGGAHPSPLPYADAVTTTTHKTLRGPRGGHILTNNEDLGKKFNSAIFPGIQGGPLMAVIAAKAVAFGEALQPDYKVYIQQVVQNAKALADTLIGHGFDIVSGGTDNHLVLVDLRPKGLTGDVAVEAAMERALHPVIRMVFRLIRHRQWSLQACVWARWPVRHVALAWQSSTGGRFDCPCWMRLLQMAAKPCRKKKPRFALKLKRCAHVSDLLETSNALPILYEC